MKGFVESRRKRIDDEVFLGEEDKAFLHQMNAPSRAEAIRCIEDELLAQYEGVKLDAWEQLLYNDMVALVDDIKRMTESQFLKVTEEGSDYLSYSDIQILSDIELPDDLPEEAEEIIDKVYDCAREQDFPGFEEQTEKLRELADRLCMEEKITEEVKDRLYKKFYIGLAPDEM